MANMRFLYNSFFDDASLALASGSVDSDWPLNWLQNETRRKACKFITDSGQINIDLGSERFISGIGLVEHDWEPRTEITLTGYSDAYTTPMISETFEAIGPIIGLGEKRLGEYSLGGWPDDEDLALLPKIVTSHWFEPTLARYWSVAADNGAPWYLGRIILGDYWEVEINPKWDLEYGLVDPSEIDRSKPSGVKYADEKERFYQARFVLPEMSDLELYGHFIQLCEHCGVRKPFILQIDDEDNKKQRFTTIYGQLLNNPLPKLKTKNRSEAQFQIEESL